MKKTWQFIKDIFKKWNEEDPFRLSAVIAYYAIFSLPAMLIIVINVAGAIFGKETVANEIYVQIKDLMGESTAVNVRNMIQAAAETKTSVIGNIIGIATLLFGATGVFFQLQISLNKIWNVESAPKNGFVEFLFKRALSLGMILVIGLLLLVSLVITTLLTALSNWIRQLMPDFILYIFFVINFLVSLGIITLLFALILKFLPDVKLRWSTVWKGALVTAFLFVLGKFGLGIYFGHTNPASVYGAAGSVILILLWVYYSCLILFLGASFTFVYAKVKKHNIMPARYAVVVKTVKIKDAEKEPLKVENDSGNEK